ncbi:MAG: DNRLRE domain-containing protein, partial [Nitrospinae bacterium]|nr:DNRLRE domain-containing protein [Nitrospinota bacterium]
MYRTERSKVGHLARAGLALAACLLLLHAPVNADTMNPSDDTYNHPKKPTKTFGKNKVVKIDSTKGHIGFILFDLTPMGTAVGADIDKATVRLFIKSVNTGGTFALHSVDSAFSEDTLTDNNKPTTTLIAGLGALTVVAGDKGSFLLINTPALTTLAKF